MKIKLLFTALMLICGITAQAQSDMLTATLTHNGVHTTYTGRDCLTDAIAASADGDVIALSGGNFSHNDYTITKPITLRGAGSSNDAEYTPTELKALSINIPEDNTGMMVVEGIRFVYNNYISYHNTWKAPNMRIQNFKSNYYSYLHLYAKQAHLYNNNFYFAYLFPQSSQADFQVQQCDGLFYLYDNNSYSYTIVFANCQGELHQTTNNVTATINHCAFVLSQVHFYNPASQSGSLSHGFYGCSFINSALVFGHYSTYPQDVFGFRQNNNLNCCIVYEQKDKGLQFYQNNSNITTLSSSLSGSGGFWDNYRPLSSWRDACTTTDGTEIGYMGGAYNATIGLSYPHFTNCTVPPVTDEEGHLNVTLTVSGVE